MLTVDIPWILLMGYEATLDGRKTSRLANHRLDVINLSKIMGYLPYQLVSSPDF